MSDIFFVLFYQPVLNLLVFLYNILPINDLGVAIILLTIVIKLILYPLSQKSLKSQRALQELQPKIEQIKKKYTNNKEEMGKAMMDLYKDNQVNPFSSCLPLLIQLPFLFAVFRVFRDGLNGETMPHLYSFIARPEIVNNTFLGILDLSKPNVILAVLAGAAQYWQTKMMMTKRPQEKSKGAKDEDMMAVMNKQMLYFMPFLTIFIGITLPGGLTLYWFITTVLTALQQLYLFNKKSNTNSESTKEKEVVEGEVLNN